MNLDSRKKGLKSINSEKVMAPTYIALLLLLSEGPAHAWHIKNLLDARGFEEWVDMKKSTIYKSLGKLEEKKLIKGSRKEEGSQISRKVYELTESGKETLQEQIQICIKNPPKPKTVFDLGLAGLCLLTKPVALSVLNEYRTNLKKSIQWFEAILQKFDNLNEIRELDKDDENKDVPFKEPNIDHRPFIVKALFERPYYSIVAQKKWLDGFIQSIETDDGNFVFKEE